MDIVTLAAAKRAARMFGTDKAGKAAVVGADGMLIAQEIAAGEIVIDDTLAIEGAAADAAAAGTAVSTVTHALEMLAEDVGSLDDLETSAKDDLVAAINEAARSGVSVEIVRLV